MITMLCPEAYHVDNKQPLKEGTKESWKNKSNKISVEGTERLELNSYKTSKTWKKSISNFFRNQLRSTKSNDGDQASGSKERHESKEVSPEQKWQSLGKIFRRQSFEQWSRASNQQEESSSSNKRFAVRKVFSGYFGKKSIANDK